MTIYLTKDCSTFGLLAGDVYDGVETLTCVRVGSPTLTNYQARALELAGYATLNISDLDVRGMEHVDGRVYANKANVYKNGKPWQLKNEISVSSPTWVENEWKDLGAVI